MDMYRNILKSAEIDDSLSLCLSLSLSLPISLSLLNCVSPDNRLAVDPDYCIISFQANDPEQVFIIS